MENDSPPQNGKYSGVKLSLTLTVPSVFVCKKFLSQYGNHPAKAVVIAVLQILVFQGFILVFSSIVGVDTDHESVLPKCPHPSL